MPKAKLPKMPLGKFKESSDVPGGPSAGISSSKSSSKSSFSGAGPKGKGTSSSKSSSTVGSKSYRDDDEDKPGGGYGGYSKGKAKSKAKAKAKAKIGSSASKRGKPLGPKAERFLEKGGEAFFPASYFFLLSIPLPKDPLNLQL